MKVFIVYDNRTHKPDLQTGWGFSVYISTDKGDVLFDTGDDPEKLSLNLNLLNLSVKDIDHVVLSHYHWDHVGGLQAILERNDTCNLFYSTGFPRDFCVDKLKIDNSRCHPVDTYTLIYEDVFVTRSFKKLFRPVEVGLCLLDKEKRVYLITGCAHPGIEDMVRDVEKFFRKKVYAVIGGFHFYHQSYMQIKIRVQKLKKLGVEKVLPTHCTGETGLKVFREVFGPYDTGAGCELNL